LWEDAIVKKLTPLKAIRSRCINCSGFETKKVKECPFDGIEDKKCPLHPLRMGRGKMAYLKKIRTYCLWCCNGQKIEIKLCPASSCSLWGYRFGKRPRNPHFCQKNAVPEGGLETNLTKTYNSIN